MSNWNSAVIQQKLPWFVTLFTNMCEIWNYYLLLIIFFKTIIIIKNNKYLTIKIIKSPLHSLFIRLAVISCNFFGILELEPDMAISNQNSALFKWLLLYVETDPTRPETLLYFTVRKYFKRLVSTIRGLIDYANSSNL